MLRIAVFGDDMLGNCGLCLGFAFALVLARALHQAVLLARLEARAEALAQELVEVRSALVLAKAREWEFHRESGRHQAME